MTKANDPGAGLLDELTLAASTGGRIPQPVIGLVATTMLGESLDAVAASLPLMPGSVAEPDGGCALEVRRGGDGPLWVRATAVGTVVEAPPVEAGAARRVVMRVAAPQALGRTWHRGRPEVHDPRSAASLFPLLRALVSSSGLAHEAHRRSRAHAERRWHVPDLDRPTHAATRLGVVLAERHGHMPPADALDCLHLKAACMEAATAIEGAATLLGHCAGDDDAWHVPGLRMRGWRTRSHEVLALVSTRGRERNASVVTWTPSADHESPTVTVGTVAGDAPQVVHGTFRLRDGRAAHVGATAGAHEHAAVRLLGHRVDAALRVVEAVMTVHDLHAILGVP